jgi:lipopolysaccharide transport system ATP-binding protein
MTSISDHSAAPAGEVLVCVEGVSKKFCRSLKKSLWYGMQDLGNELRGRRHGGDGELRPDEFWAVKDVSFELRRGECLGLIGRNGAGKTTLLRMLNGLIKPDCGRIEMRGRVSALIALGAGFNPILTGRENVYAAGAVLGMRAREISVHFESIVEFAGLAEFIDSPVQSYSTGMQVRLGFAVAAHLDPDILLLDEVLAVGDAEFQVKSLNMLRTIQERGAATILVSHNMVNILHFSDVGLYLADGRAQAFGPIVDVSSLYQASQAPTGNHHLAGNVPTDSGLVLGTPYLSDGQGNRLETALPLQPVVLHIPYQLKKALPQQEVKVGLGINDAAGVFYQSRSDPLSFPGGKSGQGGEFNCYLDGLLASAGTLSIGIAIWAHPSPRVLAWTRDMRIVMKQNSRNAGRVELSPCWEVRYSPSPDRVAL